MCNSLKKGGVLIFAIVFATAVTHRIGISQEALNKDRKLPVNQEVFPTFVTAYDIMTAEDEFYYHHLFKLTDDADVANWPLVKSLASLGHNFMDAELLARMANRSIKISEQKRATRISEMVTECAKILGVTTPPVFIEANPTANAYVSGLGYPHVLVLTSACVELFQDNPDELRFIIGHELGHIKAQHLRTHLIGRILLQSLLGKSEQEITASSSIIGVLSAGTLIHWYRESEYSADRAGLVCIGGRVDVAQQALLRLLHQTRQSNKLMESTEPGFDVATVVDDQAELRNRPLVAIWSRITEFQSSHPFIPQRCEQLRQWRESEEFANLLNRKIPSNGQVVIQKIQIDSIPKVDFAIPFVDSGEADPFVQLTYDGIESTSAVHSDTTNAVWDIADMRFNVMDGASLVLDLYDGNTLLANQLIGSCLVDIDLTREGPSESCVPLRLDIHSSSTVVDRPKVIVTYTIIRQP
jgi:Zn-dependent protease with chaperone function